MSDLALVTAGQLDSPIGFPVEQRDAIASVDIDAGEVVRIIKSGANAGKWALAQATDFELGNAYGVAMRSVKAGSPLTACAYGFFGGWDLSNVNYGDSIYLSDTAGAISSTSGTINRQIGDVIPANKTSLTGSFDKIIRFRFPIHQEAIVDADLDSQTIQEQVTALVTIIKAFGLGASAASEY